MATIDPNGLFNGDRLRRCSNSAHLYWPFLFLCSNGYGRFEINYHRIVAKCFSGFDPMPSEHDLMRCIREYADNRLLYVYEFDGQLWGQWDCPERLLNKYKTAEDKRSPSPDASEFAEWRKSYQLQKRTKPKLSKPLDDLFGEFQKTFGNVSEKVRENSSFGVGVGEGVGIVCVPPPQNSDLQVERIGHLHPVNAHLPEATPLTPEQAEVVIEAIIRDGYELVWTGTKNYREEWDRWPSSEKKLRRNFLEFYRKSEYRIPPEQWRRDEQPQNGIGNHAGRSVNATVARTVNNIHAAETALQILRDRRAEAGRDSSGTDQTGGSGKCH